MDEQQAGRVANWVDVVTAELAVRVPDDLADILNVAKDVAHSVERPAAPVSTYLMGYAVAQGADPREVAAVIATLAQEFDV
jgi:hypothetical protein